MICGVFWTIFPHQVKAVIAKEMAGPKEHLKFYDKFKDLISRKVYLKAILNYDFYYSLSCLESENFL